MEQQNNELDPRIQVTTNKAKQMHGLWLVQFCDEQFLMFFCLKCDVLVRLGGAFCVNEPRVVHHNDLFSLANSAISYSAHAAVESHKTLNYIAQASAKLRAATDANWMIRFIKCNMQSVNRERFRVFTRLHGNARRCQPLRPYRFRLCNRYCFAAIGRAFFHKFPHFLSPICFVIAFCLLMLNSGGQSELPTEVAVIFPTNRHLCQTKRCDVF